MNPVDLTQLKPQYVVNESGERTAVILPIAVFEELLEDIQDLTALAERRDEPAMSHDDLLAELKKDGLLPN